MKKAYEYDWSERNRTDISVLEGLTLFEVGVDKVNDEIHFFTVDGRHFIMYHEQDCCESVGIEDIYGEWKDLIGTPILTAEERSNFGESEWGSETWTFYTLRTVNGTVDLRWYGESNGYYSERVDFMEVTDADKKENN